jgi:hypothetical protein
MKKILAILSLISIASVLILKEERIKRPSGLFSEGCVFCHDRVSDPDPSHPISAFGCHVCHLGNSYSLDKKRAHFTMVRNPGDLKVVDRTCGKQECHTDIVARVKNSIMATNKGILKTIQSHWLKTKEPSMRLPARTHWAQEAKAIGVKDLLLEDCPENLAIDYYRKMCGGCHLWKERGDRPGEVGRRGGGCSDCHLLDKDKKGVADTRAFDHPTITTRIPSENCVKCHNRSARIGLSYFGRLESARYGTPYEGRGLNSRRLSGNRFFLQLEDDVHFRKLQMDCIDCHTATGLMGDGKSYDEMEDQLDITCQACHSPSFSGVTTTESLGNRLVSLNRKVPGIQGKRIAFSRKGTPLYNLQKQGNKVLFFRKMDGRSMELDVELEKKPHHGLPGHERLSCQACHSTWMPQCYGCHLTYRKSERQRDWITGDESMGRWKEARSYLRFLKPALGLRDGATIYPISPCQVFGSVFDEEDKYQSHMSFRVFTVSAFDPHTTSKRSRECLECHGDPKALGIGEGILHPMGETWVFRPTYDSESSSLGVSFPLDGFVSINGAPLQSLSLEGTRPFNKKEIDRIFSVNACLGCHGRYDDKIYKDFHESKRRFETEPRLPCLK